MTPPTTKIAITTLYRNLLRNAKQMNDYNFRSYSIRRIKTGFQKNKLLQGEDANVAFVNGQEQLKLLQRQVTLGELYPGAKSVME